MKHKMNRSKFSEFLFEETEHTIDDFIEMVKSKCKAFISNEDVRRNYLNEKFIFRGIQYDRTAFSNEFNSKILFRKHDVVDKAYLRNLVYKDVRKDRAPKDTSKSHHEFFDKMFLKKFNHNLRSSSLFCTTNQDQASSYGQMFVVFPTGENIEAFSSKSITDLYDNFFSIAADGYIKILEKIGSKAIDDLNRYDLYFDKIENIFSGYVAHHFAKEPEYSRPKLAFKSHGILSTSLFVAMLIFNIKNEHMTIEEIKNFLITKIINCFSVLRHYDSIEEARDKIKSPYGKKEPKLNMELLDIIEDAVNQQANLSDCIKNIEKLIEDNFDEIFEYKQMDMSEIFSDGETEIMLVCDGWFGYQTVHKSDNNDEAQEEFMNVINRIFSNEEK